MKQIIRIMVMIFILIGHSVSTLYAQEMRVVYPQLSAEDSRLNDIIELLEASLEVTVEKYGPYELLQSDDLMGEQRSVQELIKNKNINLIWMSTSPEREKTLLPIRIPLRKGLLGYRIFVINKNKQAIFSRIRDVSELKRLVLGQGHDWGDVKVYEAGGFELETADKFTSLFKMVHKGRFDYFPLGVNEAPGEVESRVADLPDLSLEKELMLFYQWPYYFFVSRDNVKLAERIQEGLEIMIKNGMFDQIFLKYHAATIEKANMGQRRLFRLENPLLPPETPFNNDKLWYDPLSITAQ
ncbi:MAG: substrate-binding periplasmic protein [Arenicella sp.]